MPKKGKDVLAIMLGGKGPNGEAFQESAAAAMSAVEAGDSEAFASALKDAIVTCLEEQGIE